MKVVVGTNTIVKKVTVGTPLRVGSAANGSLTGLDDVNGSINLADGTILQYDSNTGLFKHVSPASITGSGLNVTDSGGLGSLAYDSSTAILTYTGPSADSIHSLFNSTYDSSALGTLSYTNGTVRLEGPTAAQIRALFSAGNSLNYNETTGEFSVTVPDTSASFDSDFNTKTTDDLAEGSNLYFTDSRGRGAISVTDTGGFGSLSYNSASGEITYTGPSVADARSVINVGDNLAYDSATGKITFTGTLGGDFDAGDAQSSLSVVNDDGDYGSLSYDNTTGVFTFTKVTDSDIRSSLTAAGDLSYNSVTGEFSFTQRTDAEVRGLFSAGLGITYDSATGRISANVGVHYEDSDARKAISVVDNGGQGSLTYDNTTGEITYQGSSDSDIRGLISASGDITYNQNTGVISFTERTDAEIRGLFNVSGDLGYDTATGVFSVDLGSVDVTDSAVTRALFSVTNDGGDYGSLSYDNTTGQFTFNKVTDSDIRGSLTVTNSGSGLGNFTYDQAAGVIDFEKIRAEEIYPLFSAAGDLQYDSTTGRFSITTGAHYTDSDARNVFSVDFIGDTAFDSSPYGGASYNASTGVLTINGTTDSNIRNSLTIQDSGGLGSLNYFVKQGRIVYKGPEVADVAGLLSASEDSLSMGNFYLDSNTGHFHFKLEDDSVRSLFTVHSDDEGGASLRYDSATGVFTFSGPSTLDLRQQLSVDSAANIGDGSFTYDDSFGVFTYIGPVAAETRAHFAGGLGIDYNESTGTFRLDSSANIVTGSIVTGQLTVTDSAVINQATISNRLLVDSISATTDGGLLNIEAGSIEFKSTGRILFDTPFLHATDNRFIFAVGDSNPASIDRGGFIIGAGAAAKYMLYLDSYEQFFINTGLNVSGSLTGPTIDSINKRIDELPDSAQMKGILSAGPGLSYDNVNGIYRITSSGVVPGIYGTATQVPNITVDSLGQIDSIGLIPMSTVEAIAFDSATGQITLTTATDSYHTVVTLDPYSTTNLVEGDNLYYTRARFDSALGDNASRTQVRTYIDSAAGTEPFKDTVRGYFSVNDLGGQGALTYDSDTGQITYTGAVIRKAGNGLDLDSDTGTFRTDSTADVTFNSVQATASVTTSNLSTDSASTKILRLDPNQWTDVNVPDNIPWPRQEGDLFYFQGPDALTYSNASMNVKIGQDEIVRVYNNTGSTIAKGKVVYVTGATNDFPTIALAKADMFETVYETQGLTSHEIPDASYGYVTVRGLYGGLNTSNFNVGDIVHVSPDSAGELVTFSPQYPNYPFEVGVVLVADSATGGNVGGCIQVGLKAEVFENIRVVGNSRFDADVTIAGNLNLLGSETQTKVANLAVSDNFVFLAAGDTVTAQSLDSGLNDLTFIGTYTGDSDLAYYVKIQDADSTGDVLVWSFDSNFASLEPFESAGGPTLWNLTTNGLSGDLRYGISFEFEAATGHDSGERWQGDAAPSNLDLGLIGNYNPPDGPFARTGAFRDNADGRFKFFEGYTSEITSSVNTSDSSYQDANIQFGTGYGDIVGNVTGNVTGQVSDISNHNTSHLAEDPAATDSSGTQYFTTARARATIQAVDAGGDGSFVYDSATGTMTYTGPSEAEFYQHFKDNADSWGDLTFDSTYGTNGGFKLHERHILRHREVYADSFINNQEYFLMYSGTTGGELVKVRADTLASKIGGGGGGGAGGGLLSYVNL